MPEEEAQALADAWVASLTGAGAPVPGRLDEALEAYVADLELRGAAPNTVRNYRQCARNVSLYAGSADPAAVTSADLDEVEGLLLSRGGRGGAPLGADTVRTHHMFLRGAFAWAVRRGARPDNPMLAVGAPAPGAHEARALDASGLAAVGSWVSSALSPAGRERDPGRAVTAMAFWLGLHCGLRVGEACAVRACDVMPGHVHVAGSVHEAQGAPRRRALTKGRRPRNVSVTPEESLELASYAAWRGRLLGAPAPRGPLATRDGRWLAPSAVSAAFSGLARELGLPEGTSFHALRHTHATWLLLAGVDMRTVSERLGHADVATTMRLYAHVLPGRDAQAAAAFGSSLAALGGSANGVPTDGGGPGA